MIFFSDVTTDTNGWVYSNQNYPAQILFVFDNSQENYSVDEIALYAPNPNPIYQISIESTSEPNPHHTRSTFQAVCGLEWVGDNIPDVAITNDTSCGPGGSNLASLGPAVADTIYNLKFDLVFATAVRIKILSYIGIPSM